ncbi:MAG: DUF4143 domain-containing protein [Desulfatitalea sp.]
MRGNLFENMVIAEAIKWRYHQGKRSNLFFYRDSKGNEVDLLLVNGSDIFPIEIKAGMTITRDFLKGLAHFAEVFPNHRPKGSGLIYGGEQAQQRTDISIASYRNLKPLFDRSEETGSPSP